MTPILILIATFLGVTALIVALLLLFTDLGGNSIEDRLKTLTGNRSLGQANSITREALMSEGLTGLAGMSQSVVEKFSDLRLLFLQSDSPVPPPTFFLITAVSSGVGVALAMLTRCPLPLYPALALLFATFPLGWLLYRRHRRFKQFAKQLPDALELIARALRSGHSLASGLHVVVDEMPDPISGEFAMCYEEQNLGIPIEQALHNMHQRMPNMDFKFFATAVAIQRQSGGDLAEILDKIGHIVRERFRILGQVQALTGEGRISGVVLMGLPIVLFFAVYYLNPEYVMLLFTDELGRKMIAGAAILQVMGAIAIKKIVAIKV